MACLSVQLCIGHSYVYQLTDLFGRKIISNLEGSLEAPIVGKILYLQFKKEWLWKNRTILFWKG